MMHAIVYHENFNHQNDVIMSVMASQITGVPMTVGLPSQTASNAENVSI